MLIAIAKSNYHVKFKHRRTVLFVQGSSCSGFIVMLVVGFFVCLFFGVFQEFRSVVEQHIACYYVAEL